MRLLRTAAASAITLLALSVLSPGARAQVSLYGTYDGVRVSNSINGNTSGVNPGYTYGSYWANGFGGGLTLTVLPLGPVSVGIDLRGSSRPGSPGADTGLAGIKLGVHLPVLPLKPYVQASGGWVRTRTTIASGSIAGATDTTDFAAYEVLGGLDYPVIPHLDVRLIEVGGGQGMYLSGPDRSAPNVSLLTIQSGLVLHF